MAKAPNEEQSQLKRRARRRLVGSIALVTVVAVVLPWVLEHEPRPADQQIAIQIPSPDSVRLDPRKSALPAPAGQTSPEGSQTSAVPGDKPDATSAATPQPAPAPTVNDALDAEQAKVLSPPVKPPVAKAAPTKEKESRERDKDKHAAEAKKKAAEKPEANPEARKKPAEKVEPAEAKPASETKSADTKPYVVQVAALADAEKAAEIQKAMVAKGLKAYTEKVKTANGEVTRVRVGPFSGRDSAEKERGRMKSLGFDGNVAPK